MFNLNVKNVSSEEAYKRINDNKDLINMKFREEKNG